MNDTQRDDFQILVSLCVAVGVRPESEIAPNLRAIAREDRDLEGKVEKVGAELRENARQHRRER